MNKIKFTGSRFPNTALNGSQLYDVSRLQLFHAAITLGKSGLHNLNKSLSSSFGVSEALSHLFLINAYVDFSAPSLRLLHSPAFNECDPTEKGMVNFYLGMMFTKFFASEVLGISWLVHFSWMQRAGSAAVRHGRSTPDLLGFCPSSNTWNTFEAKGRNSGRSHAVLNQAKLQATRAVRVHNRPCALKVGAALFRENRTSYFDFHWADPEDVHGEPITMEPSFDTWKRYYRGVLEVLDFQSTRSEDWEQISLVRFDVIDEVREFLSADESNGTYIDHLGKIQEVALTKRNSKHDGAVDIASDSFIGLDGIVVTLVRDE